MITLCQKNIRSLAHPYLSNILKPTNMFYRQKILLSLIELCGGRLAKTDLQKLLFLFCMDTATNHYDFFPHKFGAFSFTTYYDKDKLTAQNILQHTDDFQLAAGQSFIHTLKPQDRTALQAIVHHIGQLRGNALVRKTYLEYPATAIRSQIAPKLLTQQQHTVVKQFQPTAENPMLFTIGYEGKTIDQYLHELIQHNVKALVDVRKNPLSRKHGFSKKQLEAYVNRVDIAYYHLPDLGIHSDLRQHLDHKQAYVELFQHYASQILPHQAEGIKAIHNILNKHTRIALTCFEAESCMCHRHKITEFLEHQPEFAIPITHI